MVIEVNIAGWVIGKVLVDNGSSADILFLKTFEKMNLSHHMLDPPEYPLQGFGGKPIKPVGKISLPVSFGDLENAQTESLTFDVVDIYHPYLTIFGRGFMNKFDAVIRQQFLCMKMPAPKGVITVFGNQQEARNIEKGHTPGQTNVYQLKRADEKKETHNEASRDKEKIEIAADGETNKVYLDDMPDRAVTIGANLSAEEDRDLVQFLNKNKDVFTWSAKDLQGVDRDVIEHTLETDEKNTSQETETSENVRGKGESSGSRSSEIARCTSNQRNKVSSLASQHCTSQKEKWKVENVCGLHRLEQGMQERRFPLGKGRQNRR
jgi:hypothetical protein